MDWYGFTITILTLTSCLVFVPVPTSSLQPPITSSRARAIPEDVRDTTPALARQEAAGTPSPRHCWHRSSAKQRPSALGGRTGERPPEVASPKEINVGGQVLGCVFGADLLILDQARGMTFS